MTLTFEIASMHDVTEIAALRNAVAEKLTREFGQGHWSSGATERGVLRGIVKSRTLRNLEISRVIVARHDSRIVGSLRLVTKKPWAIDASYFTAVNKALYLMDMAVHPDVQRSGVGTALCEQARIAAKSWPADAVRLDAYDALAGAGEFYVKAGFREMGRVVYRGVPLVYFECLV